mgnify:CR=1 FL=1
MKRYGLVLSLLCFLNVAFPDDLPQQFVSKDNHYTINYPTHWRVFPRGQGVVVFKPKPGAAFLINIQTLLTKEAGGTYPDVKALMDDFYSQVPKHVDHAHFMWRKPFTLQQSAGSLRGEQTLLTFNEAHQTLKQWQVMLVNKNDKVFQAFAYRAPEGEFDASQPLAQAMLHSWVIN